MARSKDHTNAELANRLEKHADDLTRSTYSHDTESIIRLAAERLRDTKDHGPLVLWLAAELKRRATSGESSRRTLPPVPGLVSELAKIANTTSDADTRRRLRRVLGEA